MSFIYPIESLVRSNGDLLCTFTAASRGEFVLHPGILHQKRNIIGVAFSKNSLDKNKIKEVSFISNGAPITTISREVMQLVGESEQSKDEMEIIVTYFPNFHKEMCPYMDFFVKVCVYETVDIYVRYGPVLPPPEEGVLPLKERVEIWEKIPMNTFFKNSIQIPHDDLRTIVGIYSTFHALIRFTLEDKEIIYKSYRSYPLKELIGPLPYLVECFPEDVAAIEKDPSLSDNHFIQLRWNVEVTYADGMLGLPFIPFSSNN
jgi:hypothetical protein